jgi:cellulose synthase/poly-beta-1,6-N-acetylglucosamine synthase-like glycosyltransferase
MKTSILIPTYRRVDDLQRCLEALKQQSHPADEILIVVRDNDEQTHKFLELFETAQLPLKIVDVTIPGQVAALNTGLAAATGEIISITDDDAAPHKHWLESVRNHFLADPSVGGVGGKDWLYLNGTLSDESNSSKVPATIGKLSWFGRPTGNHHIGGGEPRDADILKGANMSYRHKAVKNIRFDERLLGKGAQVCNDMAFSLAVKRSGWKLIYDPNVSIDHFSGERFDEDKRNEFNFEATKNRAFNETLTVLDNLRTAKMVFILWSFFIGTHSCFGLVQLIRFLPKYKLNSVRRFLASMEGRWQALWC